MDALYSGQAGVLALLEGAEARIHRADDFEAEIKIGSEGVSYLFRGCTDVVCVRGAREEKLRAPFEAAWEADRALRMFLISLDPEEEHELRFEAASCLEELLVKETTKKFIENEFFARALPADTDCDLAQDKHRWPLVADMLREITENQDSIPDVRAAWDRLPSTLFEKEDK